jgi:hypothetical protein
MLASKGQKYCKKHTNSFLNDENEKKIIITKSCIVLFE